MSAPFDMSELGGWRVGLLALKCAGEDEPVVEPVAGWVKGFFGLDFRVFADEDGDFIIPGWVMTHLPTGYVVRRVHADLQTAMRLADEIAAEGDWDFTDPASAKAVGAGVKRVMDRNPGLLTHGGGRLISPHFRSQEAA